MTVVTGRFRSFEFSECNGDILIMMGRDAGDKNILTLCNVEQTIDSRSGMLSASRPRGRAVQNLRPRTLLILGHFCFYRESQIITPTMKRSHTRR